MILLTAHVLTLPKDATSGKKDISQYFPVGRPEVPGDVRGYTAGQGPLFLSGHVERAVCRTPCSAAYSHPKATHSPLQTPACGHSYIDVYVDIDTNVRTHMRGAVPSEDPAPGLPPAPACGDLQPPDVYRSSAAAAGRPHGAHFAPSRSTPPRGAPGALSAASGFHSRREPFSFGLFSRMLREEATVPKTSPVQGLRAQGDTALRDYRPRHAAAPTAGSRSRSCRHPPPPHCTSARGNLTSLRSPFHPPPPSKWSLPVLHWTPFGTSHPCEKGGVCRVGKDEALPGGWASW